jgi:hypothetical protein
MYMNQRHYGDPTFTSSLEILKRIIQEHQIKPMQRYTKRLTAAKEYYEAHARTHTHLHTHMDPAKQLQLLEFLQRPPVRITLQLHPELELDPHFHVEFDPSSVQVILAGALPCFYFDHSVVSGAVPEKAYCP